MPVSTVDLGPALALEGVFNLRDLGGYAAGDQRVQRGVVFRGASLQRLAGADLDRARSLELRTAVDLRTDGELARAGGFPGEALDVTVHHLALLPSVWSPDLLELGEHQRPERFLADRFLDMLEVGGPAIAGTLQLLAQEAARPLVFFCAAGKDRTGVLAALLLSVLGVGEADIARDFHASQAPVAQMIEWLRGQEPDVVERMVGQAPALLTAPVGAMRLFLDDLRGRYGSVERYLAEAGVESEMLATLREELLEPAG